MCSAERLDTIRALSRIDVVACERPRQHREARDRRVREHPRVLAAAAALARDDLPVGAGDARQAARHARGSRRDRRRPGTRATSTPRLSRWSPCQDRRVRQAARTPRPRSRPARPRSARHPAGTARRGSPATNTGSSGVCGNAGLRTQLAEIGGDGLERGRLAAPPRRDRRQRRAARRSSRCADRRQKRQQRRRFEHARAERVGHEHAAGAHACTSPGTPSAESARSSSGSQKSSSRRRRIACTGRRPLDGLEEHAIVAHREVAAFDEREAEIAREVRVLEIGLVVRPRREQHDVRRLAVARASRRAASPAASGRTARARCTRRSRNASGNSRDNRDAVLERVARARRRLRACRQTRQPPSGPRREIEGDADGGSVPPGGVTPCAGRRNPGWPKTSAGGISPSASSCCGPYRSASDRVRAGARADARPAASGSHSAAGTIRGSTSSAHGRDGPWRRRRRCR